MSKEVYIGEATLKDNPGKKLGLIIRDGSVTTNKIADENVTTEVLAKICNELKCDVGDIMEFVPDEEKMC